MSLTADEKLRFIFDTFDATSNGYLSLRALATLALATNPELNMPLKEMEHELKKMAPEMFPKGTYDKSKGVTFEGLKHSYNAGHGDIDEDFELVKLHKTDYVSNATKALYIFEYFDPKGTGYLSGMAMVALHRATEEGGADGTDEEIAYQIEGFMRSEYGRDGLFVEGKGLTLQGLLQSYEDGAGDLDKDFEMIKEKRVSAKSAGGTTLKQQAVDATVKVAFGERMRAKHGFQMVFSFGAAKDVKGFEIDGVKMKSGFEVVAYLHRFLAWWLFGSMAEGTRHIYFDWYNLRGLPTTVSAKRPDGTTSYLNDAWHVLYDKAFRESKLILMLVSKPWLDSPNCAKEFDGLLRLMRDEPDADKEVYFLVLDGSVGSHPKWNEFEAALIESAGGDGDVWREYFLDFTTMEQQNNAFQRLVPAMQKLVKCWPLGDRGAVPITDDTLGLNYKKGVKFGVPGFDS